MKIAQLIRPNACAVAHLTISGRWLTYGTVDRACSPYRLIKRYEAKYGYCARPTGPLLPVYSLFCPCIKKIGDHKFQLFSVELSFQIPIHEICAKYLDLNSDLMHWPKVLQYWHKYNLLAGHGNTLFSRFAIFSGSSCELLTSKCQAHEVLTW